MSDTAGNLIVFRVPPSTRPDYAQSLLDAADYVTEKLKHGDAHVVVFEGVAAYYLRPGDSTEEMDARAAQIRAETLKEALR